MNEVMSAYRRHEGGMWWSNDAKNKEQFTLEYGRKFLNFYNAADNHMKLPQNAFYEQRKDIIYNIIVTYTKNDKLQELNEVIKSKKDKEIFNSCMKDIVNRNVWFLDYLINKEDEEKRLQKEREENEENRRRLEQIENSRWWKLRGIIKGKK